MQQYHAHKEAKREHVEAQHKVGDSSKQKLLGQGAQLTQNATDPKIRRPNVGNSKRNRATNLAARQPQREQMLTPGGHGNRKESREWQNRTVGQVQTRTAEPRSTDLGGGDMHVQQQIRQEKRRGHAGLAASAAWPRPVWHTGIYGAK